MKKHIIYFLAIAVIVAIGCQKELSIEGSNTPAKGSLQSDGTGDCLPKTVNGAYIAGTALVPANNTIAVQINVTVTGSYLVYTDTVNGYFFRATGTFTTLGANTVTLRSNGTPFAAGVNNFVVKLDSSVCDVQVTVLPAGTGPAVFTLAGTPNCTTPVIAGTYAMGNALNASNTVTLNVNVTTVGTYNVSTTPVGGMTFSGTGSLAIGPQTIVLTGTGTPTVAGNNTIPVTAGSSTCSFVINVVSPAIFTLTGSPTCTTPVIAGTYAVGTPLTASNTVTLNVNVTTAGAYTVSIPTVGGITFTGSGTLALGAQTILLTGTGTPTVAGNNTFPITVGSSGCSFVINVTGPPGPAVGTLSGAPTACTPSTVSGFYVVGTAFTASNKVQVQINVTTAGTYTITTNTVTGFSFSGTGTVAVGPNQLIDLAATGTPTTAGLKTFTVTFGTSTCTFTVVVLPNDYFPRTTNSNWSYEFDDVATDSLYRNVIASTLTANANVYNIFLQNDGITPPPDSSGYYRRAGGDYFEYLDYGSFVGYDNPAWAEYIMLKDNVGINTNWKTPPLGVSGTVTGTPIKTRFSYTILQKDVPITITTSILPAVTYQNVIVVEEKLEAEVTPGIWQDLTSTINYYGKSYYARGIGLIKFEAYNAANTVTSQQELRRFQIF